MNELDENEDDEEREENNDEDCDDDGDGDLDGEENNDEETWLCKKCRENSSFDGERQYITSSKA